MKCRSTFGRRDLLLRHDHTVHAEDGSLPLRRDIPTARAVNGHTASANELPPIGSPSQEELMPVLPSIANSLPNSAAGTPIPPSPWTAESQAGLNAPQVSGDGELNAVLDHTSRTDFEHAIPNGFDLQGVGRFTTYEFADDVNFEDAINALTPLATPQVSLGNADLEDNCSLASQEGCTHPSLKQSKEFSKGYGNSLSLAGPAVEDWARELAGFKKLERSNDSGYFNKPTNRPIVYSLGQAGTTQNEPRNSDGCIKSRIYNTPSPELEGSVDMAEPGALDSEDEDSIDLSSDSSTRAEYSEPTYTLEWDPFGEVVGTLKREYVESLLSTFQLLQRQCPAETASEERDSDSSNGSVNGKHRDTSSPSGTHTSGKPAKRRKINGAGDNSDEDEEDNHQQKVPWPIMADEFCYLFSYVPSPTTQKKSVNGLMFACPFVKRSLDRYRKCYAHDLSDISRVKFHLKRCKYHHLPLYCPKCSEIFENRRLHDEHSRVNNCPILPPRSWDGITPEQSGQLSKRTSPKKTAEENWYDIYKIIFPGEPLPSSPYIDVSLSGELSAFREHQLSQGPTIWEDIIRKHLPPHLQQHSEELQSFFISSYQEAVGRLHQGWFSRNQQTSPLPSQSTPLPSQSSTQETSTPAESNDILIGGALESPPRSDSAIGSSVSGSSENERQRKQKQVEQQQLEQLGPEQQQITTQAGSQPMVQPSPIYQTMPLYTTLVQFPPQVLQGQTFSDPMRQTNPLNPLQQPFQNPQTGQFVPFPGSDDFLHPIYTPTGGSMEPMGPTVPQSHHQPQGDNFGYTKYPSARYLM